MIPVTPEEEELCEYLAAHDGGLRARAETAARARVSSPGSESGWEHHRCTPADTVDAPAWERSANTVVRASFFSGPDAVVRLREYLSLVPEGTTMTIRDNAIHFFYPSEVR